MVALKQWSLLGIFGVASVLGIGCEKEKKRVYSVGWGINVYVGQEIQRAQKERNGDIEWFEKTLEEGNLTYLRDRLSFGLLKEGQGKEQIDFYEKMKKKNIFLLLHSGHRGAKKERKSVDFASEDLIRVFQEAKQFAEKFKGCLWELNNEPDVGYFRDLPDRSAAHMKAVYLGLKAGGGLETPVLMGALALPPGPWLERATRNGVLDYADAYNFHYYGHARDFSSVIRAHRFFLNKAVSQYEVDKEVTQLPIWVTEIGYQNRFSSGKSFERELKKQAQYLGLTMKQAIDENVVSFMPYVFRSKRLSKFALVDSENQPNLAWKRYIRKSKEWQLRQNPTVLLRGKRNPIVLQWVPNAFSCLPHKVSGTYRFNEKKEQRLPITGELRIYNFGQKKTKGVLEWSSLNLVKMKIKKEFLEEIEILPMQFVSVPVSFECLEHERYFREWLDIKFKASKQNVSKLFFGLETLPKKSNLKKEKIKGVLPTQQEKKWNIQSMKEKKWNIQSMTDHPEFEATSISKMWLGIDGAKVSQSQQGGEKEGKDEDLIQVWVKKMDDPIKRFPLIVTKIEQLPEEGFIRIKADRFMGRGFRVRMDIIDCNGQRFSVFENGGRNYRDYSKELWLNLKDFHLYFWGRCLPDCVFEPENARELQIRIYAMQFEDPVELQIDLMTYN